MGILLIIAIIYLISTNSSLRNEISKLNDKLNKTTNFCPNCGFNLNNNISSVLKELISEHKSKEFCNGVTISDNIFLKGKVYVKVLIKDSNTIGLLIIRVKNGIRDINLFLNMVANLLLK